MRCFCCNACLSTKQSVRKFKNTETFVDMCDKCLDTISEDVSVKESRHLKDSEDYYEDQDF